MSASIGATAGVFAVLWIGAAIDYSVQIYDEGSLLNGARAVAHGALPLRDFWTAYPPGIFWLVGLAFRVFGEQMLVNRAMHAAFVLGICVVSYALVLALSRSRGWALLAFLMVTLYGGAIRVNYGYPPVLCTLLGLLGLYVLSGGADDDRNVRIAMAGLSTGLAAVFRYDFALYIGAATVVAIAVRETADRGRAGVVYRLGSALAVYVAAVLVPVVIAYGVVIAGTGARRTFDLLVDFPLRVFPRVRALPMAPPFAALRNGPTTLAAFGEALLYDVTRLPYYLPILVAPLGVAAGFVLWRREKRSEAALLLALGVLTALLVNQFRVRSGDAQGWPLSVVGIVAALSTLALVSRARERRWRVAARLGAVAYCSVLTVASVRAETRLVRDRYFAATVPVASSRAAGIRIPQAESWYNDVLELVARRGGGETALYSGVIDHDQLVFNDVLVYFLSGLRPPTYFPELCPGVVDTVGAQQRIVRELGAHDVRTVLLYDWISTEPNDSSINTRVDVVDRYLRDRFEPLTRIKPYVVMAAPAVRPPG